jgi:hypothetical protein
MWGAAIIGFGEHHYRYPSGREGDWFVAGFSPRKEALTLYLTTGFERRDEIMRRLGKHRTGKACIYVERLADLDLDALRRLIRDSVAHAKRISRPVTSASGGRARAPLWTCPRCGHRFVTRNLWHSCGTVDLESHFAGKPPERRATFDSYVALARACGPITVYAQKTRIVIQARVRFAGAVVRRGWLDAGMWLRRRAAHPRLRRVEDLGRDGYVHRFRLTAPAECDAALAALMREAYRVGTQEAAARSSRR